MSRKSRRTAGSVDALTKTAGPDAIKLDEQELKRVAGGAIYMKWDGIDGAVTTNGFKDRTDPKSK